MTTLQGLSHVMAKFKIKELWINDHRTVLAASAGTAINAITDAEAKGIVVRESLLGTISADRIVEIVGPDKAHYDELRPKFRARGEIESDLVVSSANTADVDEWGTERLLGSRSSTSSSNNSSAITLVSVGDIVCLLTGYGGSSRLTARREFSAPADMRPPRRILFGPPINRSTAEFRRRS